MRLHDEWTPLLFLSVVWGLHWNHKATWPLRPQRERFYVDKSLKASHYMLELATRFHLQTLSTMKLQQDCFALVRSWESRVQHATVWVCDKLDRQCNFTSPGTPSRHQSQTPKALQARLNSLSLTCRSTQKNSATSTKARRQLTLKRYPYHPKPGKFKNVTILIAHRTPTGLV